MYMKVIQNSRWFAKFCFELPCFSQNFENPVVVEHIVGNFENLEMVPKMFIFANLSFTIHPFLVFKISGAGNNTTHAPSHHVLDRSWKQHHACAELPCVGQELEITLRMRWVIMCWTLNCNDNKLCDCSILLARSGQNRSNSWVWTALMFPTTVQLKFTAQLSSESLELISSCSVVLIVLVVQPVKSPHQSAPSSSLPSKFCSTSWIFPRSCWFPVSISEISFSITSFVSSYVVACIIPISVKTCPRLAISNAMMYTFQRQLNVMEFVHLTTLTVVLHVSRT